ncbi:MAG: glycosyltransferase [Nitrospirae bacterium]|nr:glycosyltransferase [Nitrospirota bacterium]
MIKVCYIIGQLGKGGAERQLYELVKGLDRERFHPVVISLSQGGLWKDEIQKLNVQVIELQRKKNWEFSRLLKLFRLLKSVKPDIVHTFMFSANSYGRVAAVLCRVPVIIASERCERNKYEMGKYQNYIDRLLALFSQGIICNSRGVALTLINKYSFASRKIMVVHNGINADNFFKQDCIGGTDKRAQKIIVTVGRLYHQKNHRLFLEAAKIVLKKSEDKEIKFLIIGKGPLQEELENYAESLGIRGNVIFAGERNDIPEVLHDADIFVMTSLYEGMPNAVMEAMAAGLPVVASDVGGSNELVVDGETGFLCPCDNAALIAERVIHLLADPQNSSVMGERGRERILRDFTLQKMVDDTQGIYIKLLYGTDKILSGISADFIAESARNISNI